MLLVDIVKFLIHEAEYYINYDNPQKNIKASLDIYASSTTLLIANNLDNYQTQQHATHFDTLQTYAVISKTPYYKNRPYNDMLHFIRLNTKNGLKLKAARYINASVQTLYQIFGKHDEGLMAVYPNYASLLEYSRNFSDEFYQPDFFFTFLYTALELVFLVKRIKPLRKKKKKRTISAKLKVSYVPGHLRKKITFRWINAYCVSYRARTAPEKFINALCYLVLAGSTSFLHKKKLTLYKRLLEKKKFY